MISEGKVANSAEKEPWLGSNFHTLAIHTSSKEVNMHEDFRELNEL